MARSSRPIDVRFWEKVRRGSGCWEWTASTNHAGYGQFLLWDSDTGCGTSVLSHRQSWEMAKGPIPEGQCVLHRCDNPACVRPDHLFLGDRVDNKADQVAKGRQQVGADTGTAKLREAEVLSIHSRYSAGDLAKDLAAEFGVHKSTIAAIVRGRSWRYLGLPVVADGRGIR